MSKTTLVELHVRIPRALLDKLLVKRDAMRRDHPMVTLSEAVRIVLESGVKEKR